MTGNTIPDYPVAPYPLPDNAVFPVWQGGAQRQVSLGAIAQVLASIAQGYSDLAQQWAEGTLPGGVGTKSSLEWSTVASGYASQGLSYLTATAAAALSKFVYATKAAATAAVATPAINDYVQVLVDESQSMNWSIYQKTGTSTLTLVGIVRPGPRTWYVNPGTAIYGWGAGSDSNTGITPAAPFATLAHAKTVWGDEDTVRFAPGAIITENSTWCSDFGSSPNYSQVVHFEGAQAQPVVFQQFDKYAGTWTDDGTGNNTYTGAFGRQWYSTTTTPTGTGGQQMSYRMLVDTSQLQEVQLAAVAGLALSFTTEAACLAYVRANPGTFYVRGYNGSSMYKGWQQLTGGTTETIYVHTADNLAPNAGGRTVSIGNRHSPKFNKGAKISNIISFGDVGHNGVMWRGCAVKNCRIFFPLHHAQFMAASDLYEVEVHFANQTQGGYAFHNFDDNGANPGQGTRMTRCRAFNFYGAFNALVGGHGTDATNNPIIDWLESDGFYAYNTMNLGGSDLVKFNQIWRGGTFLNHAGIQPGIGMQIQDCVFVQGKSAYNTAVFTGLPVAGTPMTVANCTFAYGFAPLIAAPSATSGATLSFSNCKFLGKGDVANSRWLFLSGAGVSTVNFDSCVISSDYDDNFVMQTNATYAGWVFNFTNCHVSGVALSGANITFNIDEHTVIGGNTHLTRSPEDGRVMIGPQNMLEFLGQRVKKLAAYNLNLFGQSSQFAYALTSRNLLQVSQSGGVTNPVTTLPTGIVLNTLAYVKGASNWWVILVGQNGAIYKMASGGSALTAITSSRTKNWTAIVDTSQVDMTATGGKTWLLASDGSITEYVADTDTFTDRTSGVSFPLTGGFYDGTDILVWGGDARGNAAGTAGGIIQSTDAGATWANSLANGDGSPASIGTFAYKVACGTKVNSNWLVFGAKGTMLQGSKGASGTGSITSNVLTITGTPTGVYRVGQTITGTSVGAGRTITSLGTATGGAGTYNVSSGTDAASTTITGTDTKISWTVRALRTDIDFRICRSDNITSGNPITMSAKKVLLFGTPNRAASDAARGQHLMLLDTSPSSTDWTTWTTTEVTSPLSGISDIALVTNGQAPATGAYFEFVLAGKHPEFAFSEDGKGGWRRYKTFRYDYATQVWGDIMDPLHVTKYIPS